MSRRRRTQAPKGALASVAGGAVTSERLARAAQREGRAGSPVVRSLLAQSLPCEADLARVYSAAGGIPRLDASFLTLAPGAVRWLDAQLLRTLRCVPIAIMEDLCVLAVSEHNALEAVRTVRAALKRDILPVLADSQAMQSVLQHMGAPPHAVSGGGVRRKTSPVQAHFQHFVLGGESLDPLPLPRVEGR